MRDTPVVIIAATTTTTGLSGESYLDTASYPARVSVSDDEMDALTIERHPFHPDWNYTIRTVAPILRRLRIAAPA